MPPSALAGVGADEPPEAAPAPAAPAPAAGATGSIGPMWLRCIVVSKASAGVLTSATSGLADPAPEPWAPTRRPTSDLMSITLPFLWSSKVHPHDTYHVTGRQQCRSQAHHSPLSVGLVSSYDLESYRVAQQAPSVFATAERLAAATLPPVASLDDGLWQATEEVLLGLGCCW